MQQVASLKYKLSLIKARLDHYFPPPLPNPATSCRDLHDRNPDAPSDYYWIGKSGSTAVKVYCDMTRTWGNLMDEGGLHRHDQHQPTVSYWVDLNLINKKTL